METFGSGLMWLMSLLMKFLIAYNNRKQFVPGGTGRQLRCRRCCARYAKEQIVKILIAFLLLFSTFIYACEENQPAEFEAFVDAKPDSLDGLNVTVFVPYSIDNATISQVVISVRKENEVKFAIYSDFLLSKDFEDYEKWEGSAFVNF